MGCDGREMVAGIKNFTFLMEPVAPHSAATIVVFETVEEFRKNFLFFFTAESTVLTSPARLECCVLAGGGCCSLPPEPFCDGDESTRLVLSDL